MELNQHHGNQQNGEYCVAIWLVLLEVWDANRAEPNVGGVGIKYRDLADRADVPRHMVGQQAPALISIGALCDAAGHPPLSVLAVKSRPRTRNRRPGPGYDPRFGSVAEDKRRVLAFNWNAVPVPNRDEFP